MKNVLITGAEGFVGSHVTESLVRSGYDVTALVLYNSFNSWGWLETLPAEILTHVDVRLGDVRDFDSVSTAMQGVDGVIHLAALVAIPFSYSSPKLYIDTNVSGTFNVLQAAKLGNVSRLVHASTSEVYGSARFVPITEEHPINPQSPYAASKVGADALVKSFCDSYDIPGVIIRPFNIYGPRQSTRAIIPTIITQLLGTQDSVRVGATSPTRDFTFVEDAARGFNLALTADVKNGEVYNLGSGFEVSILQIFNLVKSIVGAEKPITTDINRVRPVNSEVQRLFASNEKSIKTLNWEPKFGGLEGFRLGLEKTVEWFSRSENLSRYKVEKYTI